MSVLLLVLALVIGFAAGWFARLVIKRRPKLEDRYAGLRRFQALKAARGG